MLLLVNNFKMIEMLLNIVRVRSQGGNSHVKGAGMLVVSLRDVNFRFWSCLGCSGQNTMTFSRKGLF